MLCSLLVGVIAGLGAVLFYLACQVVSWAALEGIAGYHPSAPRGEPEVAFLPALTTTFTPWLLLIVPVVGGLLSGVLVYSLAPEAEGHGTDAAIEAYHYKNGLIRPRVPLVKIVASALSLGTGGSGGREGPIAQIGAGFGSYLGTLLRLRPEQRRVLMAAGMGAGVAAIFRAPLAGALFAAEVLYKSPDFESEVIIPAGLASVAAYCTFGSIFGWKSLFDPDPVSLHQFVFNNPLELLPYSLLALLVVLLAMIYTRSFYGLTNLFHRLPIKPHFRPAIGALLTGIIGVGLYYAFAGYSADAGHQALGVLSFGYGSLQYALNLSTTSTPSMGVAALLAAIAVGKIATTGLTIGSGGSGGVFGPSMVIGGCAGGALGITLHAIYPPLVPHPASFVMVGMAGFFAAAAKTPFSTLVIVSEMTGNYNLLLPTLWVCAIAFLLSDEQSIYSAQVASRALSPAHQGNYVREVLAGIKVAQFLSSKEEVAVLRPGDNLETVMQRLGAYSGQSLPVADAEGRLLGVVTLDEVHLASQSPNLGRLVLASDLMRSPISPLRPEDRLDRALEVFVEQDLLELPVVDGTTAQKVVGMVKRSDVSREYLRRVQGEPNRDGAASSNSEGGS
jgi:CIC family chloride channel protein